MMVLAVTSIDTLSALEDTYIALVNPAANGAEVQHMVQLTRRVRQHQNGRRGRNHQGVRSRTQQKRIRHVLEQWGRPDGVDDNVFSRTLVNYTATFSKLHVESKQRKERQCLLLKNPGEISSHLLCRRARLTGLAGPIDLYDEDSRLLFTRLAALRSPKLSVSRFLNSNGYGVDQLYLLRSWCRELPLYRSKMRALTRIDAELRKRGLPLLHFTALRCVFHSAQQAVRGWLNRVLASQTLEFPNWVAETRRSTRVVVLAAGNWNRRLVNSQAFVRNFKWSSLENDVSGDVMIRFPASTRCPVGVDLDELNDQQRLICGKWLCQVGLRGFARKAGQAHISARDVQRHNNAVLSPETLTFMKLHESRDSSHIIVHEDKDPSVVWWCSAIPFMRRWKEMVLGAKDRWCVSDWSRKRVVDHYRKMLNHILPNTLLPYDREVSINQIPYVLPAIKKKCFMKHVNVKDPSDLDFLLENKVMPNNENSDLFDVGDVEAHPGPKVKNKGDLVVCPISLNATQSAENRSLPVSCPSPLGEEAHPRNKLGRCRVHQRCDKDNPHSCVKDGHACVRNIVSFFRVPGRKTFRRVGRAFRLIVNSVYNGFDIPNLTTAGDYIDVCVKKQWRRSPQSSCTCVGCGCQLSHPTLITADAGQAYEVIETEFINSTISDIFNRVKQKAKSSTITVQVMKTTKDKSSFGGLVSEKLGDRTIFYLNQIKHCVESLLKLNIFRWGDVFLRQVWGIPIGGPLSGAVLCAALGRLESMFDKYGWKNLSKQWGLSVVRDEWISICRYVDDLVIISYWVCPACIIEAIPLIYKKVVFFDIANDSAYTYGNLSVVKFLDLWLFVSFDFHGVKFKLSHRNDVFAITGLSSSIAKNRFPLPIGVNGEKIKRMIQDMKARLSRFKQVHATNNDVVFLFLLDFLELFRLGYELPLIQRAWYQACRDCVIRDLGLSVLNFIRTNVHESTRQARERVRPLLRPLGSLERTMAWFRNNNKGKGGHDDYYRAPQNQFHNKGYGKRQTPYGNYGGKGNGARDGFGAFRDRLNTAAADLLDWGSMFQAGQNIARGGLAALSGQGEMHGGDDLGGMSALQQLAARGSQVEQAQGSNLMQRAGNQAESAAIGDLIENTPQFAALKKTVESLDTRVTSQEGKLEKIEKGQEKMVGLLENIDKRMSGGAEDAREEARRVRCDRVTTRAATPRVEAVRAEVSEPGAGHKTYPHVTDQQVRRAMRNVSAITVDKTIAEEFVAETLQEMPQGVSVEDLQDSTIPWVDWWQRITRAKSKAQWKKMATDLGCFEQSVNQCRFCEEVGRLITVSFAIKQARNNKDFSAYEIDITDFENVDLV